MSLRCEVEVSRCEVDGQGCLNDSWSCPLAGGSCLMENGGAGVGLISDKRAEGSGTYRVCSWGVLLIFQ